MENIITSKFFNTILLLTIIGEFFLPWILGKYYDGYNSKTMVMSAAIGFMTFLFFPLLNGILAFKQDNFIFGVISVISFILALIFFVCFIMGDKEQFQNTMLRYEGLWERLTLLCMYIPLVYKAVHNLSY